MRLAIMGAMFIVAGMTFGAKPAAPPPSTQAAGPAEIVMSGVKLQQLGTHMRFTEGPVWTRDSMGNPLLVFSDIPASELKSWSESGGVKTFRHDAHQPNGNTIDRQGRLITCHHEARLVTRTELDGSVNTLIDLYKGKKFNSPNDVVVKSDGTIWFTDPPYGLLDRKKEMEGNYVFCLEPVRGAGAIKAVVEDFDMPNGLCFSPDEKKLYIADSGKPHHIRVFDVVTAENDKEAAVPWELKNGRIFCVIDKGVPDGIRCDETGNVYSSAEDGVHVFTPEGKLIGKIPVPETPANLCFGGAEYRTLFITARSSLYSIRVNIAGANKR